MKIKSFSCSADSAGTIIIAAKLAQFDKKAVNVEYFDRLCLSIGREFVAAIADDPKQLAFIEAKTSAFIEQQKILINTDDHEMQDH